MDEDSRRHIKLPRIWGVDFDGTLCRNKWPEIGAPNTRLIRFLKAKRKKGDAVILITMREGEAEKAAVEWCKSKGLEFDAVNDNLEAVKQMYGNNPRKIFCNVYLDDRNISMREMQWELEKLYQEGSFDGEEEVSKPVPDAETANVAGSGEDSS